MESSPERCLSGLSASDGIRRCLDLDPTLGSLSLDLGLDLELELQLGLGLGVELQLELELGLELEGNLHPRRLASRRRRHPLESPPHLHRPRASPSRCRQRSNYRQHGADLDVALVLRCRLGDPRRL